MKVIHYIPSLDRSSGGTTAYMQLLTKELTRLVELYVVSHASENPVVIDNCTVYFIPEFRNFMGMKRQWRILLTQLQPDVVHVNCCWMPACAFIQKWAQALGYKVVLTPHGMLEPWIMARHYWTRKLPALWFYQKAAVMKADVLHATAESEKENLLKLGYNNRIKIIANGIDVENIEMKSSWKRNKEILFLSRVHVKKGVNFLLEAVAIKETEYVSAIDFSALDFQNPDVVAWIQIPGTQINYPVVQGKDNDYYLHRDLNGQKSTAGTIFLDYADQADFSSLHNVLYGHHMKNGSMFKDISRYKDQGYFDQHSEIILYTPEREIHLKALAAVCTSPDAIRRKTEFASGEEFASYIQQMTAGASASAPVEGTIVRLYSFVTCSYEFNNARTILYAYESAE